MKKILPLIVTILLIGCVGTVPIKSEQKANLHKIAVVSLLGDEFRFTKIGFTVFNNDTFAKDSSTWKLDNLIEKNIAETIIHTSPDIQIVQVPFDRTELFRIYKPAESFGTYQSLDRIDSELKKKTTETPVDAIILVHNNMDQDPIGRTSVPIAGYGVYYRSMPFVDPFIKPFALFSIVALDGKTLKPISEKYVRGISAAYGKSKISWDDQLKNNMSDQLSSEFRSEIEALIKNNIKSGLKEMGF